MPQAKPNIQQLLSPVHGSIGFASLKSTEDILDFSTCCNPYSPPAIIRRAMAGCDIQHYPDPESEQLVHGLSNKLGIKPENIIAGSGSTELLRMIATAYFGEKSTVLLLSPTYGEYETACSIVNARLVKYVLQEKQGFRLDSTDFISFAQPLAPAGIFICNPNNPTGQYLSRPEIENLISALPDTLLILDEAYIAFTPAGWNSLDLLRRGNLVIVRSMTKDFALAGLRLGYAVATQSTINTLKKVRPPWNVSTPAQQAGLAALDCEDYIRKSNLHITECKNYLISAISRLGFTVNHTQTNFFLVRTGHAAAFRQKLLQKNILVRDCTSFGLPDYIRISPRNMSDCRKLVQTMKQLAGDKA